MKDGSPAAVSNGDRRHQPGHQCEQIYLGNSQEISVMYPYVPSQRGVVHVICPYHITEGYPW